MPKQTAGIHHITAIVGDPQENLDFYTGVLGLRLVKKTVNFDDPGTYHFYLGNEEGTPGTIMTFFPWPRANQGKRGSGQVGITSFAVPEGTLSFWERRLQKFGVTVTKNSRFGEEFLEFDDPHGLRLELVTRKQGRMSQWSTEEVPAEVGIKGFGGAVLYPVKPEPTMDLLETGFRFRRTAEEEEWVRYQSFENHFIDVYKRPLSPGLMGVGTVHHIAWRSENEGDQAEWQHELRQKGFATSNLMDRQYFSSIYFREKGGILFEMATDLPGFTRDEPFESLGEKLLLPPWLEPHRKQIEQALPSVQVGGREKNQK